MVQYYCTDVTTAAADMLADAVPLLGGQSPAGQLLATKGKGKTVRMMYVAGRRRHLQTSHHNFRLTGAGPWMAETSQRSRGF